MTVLHSPDDELLSAYIDGVGDEADAVHIESCSACQARLGELRGVVARVATPVPVPDPHRRDRAVAAALAARADAGRRRASFAVRRLRHPVVPLVVVLGLLALLVPRLLLGGGSSDDRDSRSDVPIVAVDLGSVEDENRLGDDVEDGLERGRTEAALDPDAADRAEEEARRLPCEAAARDAAGGGPAGPVLSGRLEWRGETAVVHVYERSGASISRRMLVLSARGCRLLVDRAL